MEPVELPDGLVLRSANEADAAQIPAFSADAHGENERHATAVLLDRAGEQHAGRDLDDPNDVALTAGRTDWTVVVDGDQVVSTTALFAHRLRLADVHLPVGQLEYVATAPSHQRQGLVRHQFDVLHRRSAERGDLLTLVSGIPHYYRRLGYGYALDWPERFVVPNTVDAPDGVSVRPAQVADLDALAALHDDAQARVGVALRRPPSSWVSLLTDGPGWNDSVWVAEVDGQVEGSLRYVTWPEEPVVELMEGTATSIAVGTALLADARRRAGDRQVCCFARPGTPFSVALRALCLPTARWHPTYARIADPMALLEALRPALSRRLAASPWVQEEGEVLLSWFEGAALLHVAGGAVTAIEAADPVEDPEDVDESGIAPDALAALLLGRFGAEGLERRTDDVLLGRHRALLSVLFPRLLNDHTFAI